MKRDLVRKQNIENSDSVCAADLALPSSGEFSKYRTSGWISTCEESIWGSF